MQRALVQGDVVVVVGIEMGAVGAVVVDDVVTVVVAVVDEVGVTVVVVGARVVVVVLVVVVVVGGNVVVVVVVVVGAAVVVIVVDTDAPRPITVSKIVKLMSVPSGGVDVPLSTVKSMNPDADVPAGTVALKGQSSLPAR